MLVPDGTSQSFFVVAPFCLFPCHTRATYPFFLLIFLFLATCIAYRCTVLDGNAKSVGVEISIPQTTVLSFPSTMVPGAPRSYTPLVHDCHITFFFALDSNLFSMIPERGRNRHLFRPNKYTYRFPVCVMVYDDGAYHPRPCWGCLPRSIARQPRECQYRTVRLWKALSLGEMLPTPIFFGTDTVNSPTVDVSTV